jgi:hypothetical protein
MPKLTTNQLVALVCTVAICLTAAIVALAVTGQGDVLVYLAVAVISFGSLYLVLR